MKKLVLISTLIATFAGLSAFGQGYFLFTTGKSQVWNGLGATATPNSTAIDVAFLWSAGATAPDVSAILSSVPTSATTGNTVWSASAAWSDILNDPNYTLALNNTSGLVASVAATANGAINYNSGTAVGIANTSVGTLYHVYEIAWNGAYATPALASAANAAVGWSSVFTYTAYAFTATPTGFTGLAPQFGTGGIVPEPTTMALAGLGGLALLAFRRRS